MEENSLITNNNALKKKILSINGGGVRGLIPLYTLREIEKKYDKPIAHIFDYFAGSSIGTVIISALLISDDGINPIHRCEELYDMIEKLCKEIFQNSFYHRITTAYGWVGSKYPTENLEKILDQFFGERKLKDLLKPVCYPSFDGLSQKPVYFTREKHGDLLIKDILRGTTAAPTYFDPKELLMEGVRLNCGQFDFSDKKHLLYDSGIVVNNPGLVAELHATHNMRIIDKSQIFELCLGTGDSKVPQPTNNGMWGWVNSIIGYLFSGFNENEMYQLYLALDKDNVLFVNVDIDSKYDQLDNASDESIKYYTSKIEEWMNNNSDRFYDFMDRLLSDKKIDN